MQFCPINVRLLQVDAQLKDFVTDNVASFFSYVDMGTNRGQGERKMRIRRMVEPDYEKDGFFCGPPGKQCLRIGPQNRK